MSQFLVVQFKISAKGSLARPAGYETVAVELPVKHCSRLEGRAAAFKAV
jgi:hypothetical protein